MTLLETANTALKNFLHTSLLSSAQLVVRVLSNNVNVMT